ncbi:MAG: thioesterase family protein, partial [Pseudomonadota bacterium]
KFWPVLRKNGWFPVICAQHVVINRMLRQPQKFILKTQVVGWDDTYVCLRHSFLRDETQHAELRVVARFASRNRKRVDTDQVMRSMGFTHSSPDIDQQYLDMIAEVRAGRETVKSAPQVESQSP